MVLTRLYDGVKCKKSRFSSISSMLMN